MYCSRACTPIFCLFRLRFTSIYTPCFIESSFKIVNQWVWLFVGSFFKMIADAL